MFISYREIMKSSDHKLYLIRPKQAYIPLDLKLPSNYSIKNYQPGDELNWAKILVAAQEFDSIYDALHRFYEEFMSNPILLHQYCVFINDHNTPVATAMIWKDKYLEEELFRIHWVATDPKHQRKNLATYLLNALLSKLHQNMQELPDIYLATQLNNIPAQNLYKNFGFIPHQTSLSQI